MLKELKSLWIKDLESGKYDQCQETLFDGKKGYCCLGVLLHHTFPRSGIKLKDNYGFDITKDAGYDEELSRAFREAIDLATTHMSHLIQMNDGDRKTFAEIAQWLRDNKEV